MTLMIDSVKIENLIKKLKTLRKFNVHFLSAINKKERFAYYTGKIDGLEKVLSGSLNNPDQQVDAKIDR